MNQQTILIIIIVSVFVLCIAIALVVRASEKFTSDMGVGYTPAEANSTCRFASLNSPIQDYTETEDQMLGIYDKVRANKAENVGHSQIVPNQTFTYRHMDVDFLDMLNQTLIYTERFNNMGVLNHIKKADIRDIISNTSWSSDKLSGNPKVKPVLDDVMNNIRLYFKIDIIDVKDKIYVAQKDGETLVRFTLYKTQYFYIKPLLNEVEVIMSYTGGNYNIMTPDGKATQTMYKINYIRFIELEQDLEDILARDLGSSNLFYVKNVPSPYPNDNAGAETEFNAYVAHKSDENYDCYINSIKVNENNSLLHTKKFCEYRGGKWVKPT